MVEERGAAPSPFERAIVDLARKSVEAPKHLAAEDLEPLRAAVGDSAITYALVAGSFHFVNRIADLLHVDPEALPEGLRRFEVLRRVSVWMAARLFRRVDLANRAHGRTYAETVAESGPVIETALGEPIGERLAPLRTRPHVIDILRLALEERDSRSSLSRVLIARIQQGVEDALPACRDDAVGFHVRPADPVEALVFVGTRYPARTTVAMIDALRVAGFDDLGVLDLAIAIADANQWARTHRLMELDPRLFYLEDMRIARGDAIET